MLFHFLSLPQSGCFWPLILIEKFQEPPLFMISSAASLNRVLAKRNLSWPRSAAVLLKAFAAGLFCFPLFPIQFDRFFFPGIPFELRRMFYLANVPESSLSFRTVPSKGSFPNVSYSPFPKILSGEIFCFLFISADSKTADLSLSRP